MAEKSKTYWKKRQEKKYQAGEKKINDYYLGLKKSFEQSKKEIEKVIYDFVMRFGAENNSPSYATALRKLNKTEIGDLQAFIDKAKENMGKYNLELNNMSIRSRITRYQALVKQIDAQLQQLYAIEYQYKGGELLKEIYSDSYYQTWFNIDQYFGFHAEYSQVNAKAVDELISYPFNGANFSTRLWKQKDFMLQQLNESITTMLIQGRNPQTLTKDFAKKFGTKEYEAYRLLHTEGSFIIEQGTQAAYKEDGVEKYQWLATLDSKTCEECQPLDGKVFEVGKGITGVNLTPKHCFCRCTTVPYYDDENLSEDTRVARDPVTGKNYSVPADMTYPQWYDKYITGKTRSDFNNILGTVTSNGVEITGISEHTVSRAMERNVSADNVRNTLINPIKVGKIKTDNEGRKSQRFIGMDATVNINPETGNIATIWSTGSKTKKKYGGG